MWKPPRVLMTRKVCQWLAIFFRAKDEARAACHAGYLGALTDLAKVSGERADVWAIVLVQKSLGIFDRPPSPPGEAKESSSASPGLSAS